MPGCHRRNLRWTRQRLGIDDRPVRHGRRSDSRKGAAEIDALELREERVVVSDKILRNELGNFVEAPERHLIGRAESPCHSLEGLLDSFRRATLQVIVDQDGSGQWEAIRRKHGNGLLDSIFKDSKVALLEVGNQPAGTVLHGDGHNDERYGGTDPRLGVR